MSWNSCLSARLRALRISDASSLYADRVHSKDRSSFWFKIGYALRHPGRRTGYVKRRGRDAWLRAKSSDAARSREGAVGSHTHESWLEIGQLQFDYAVSHGLKPDMRMLEIGCGNLRAGRLFIDYLDADHYYGLDISPDILMAAQDTIAEHGLAAKLPHLTLVRDLRLHFLPDGAFDFVHAHSVFSHSPIEVIDECLAHVGRVLAPGGFFDFTFDRTEGTEHHVLHEDFYYQTQTLIALAVQHGLEATFMADWDATGHAQSKIRVTSGGAQRPPGD
jgi:SAM-dependent methyltransferase